MWVVSLTRNASQPHQGPATVPGGITRATCSRGVWHSGRGGGSCARGNLMTCSMARGRGACGRGVAALALVPLSTGRGAKRLVPLPTRKSAPILPWVQRDPLAPLPPAMPVVVAWLGSALGADEWRCQDGCPPYRHMPMPLIAGRRGRARGAGGCGATGPPAVGAQFHQRAMPHRGLLHRAEAVMRGRSPFASGGSHLTCCCATDQWNEEGAMF